MTNQPDYSVLPLNLIELYHALISEKKDEKIVKQYHEQMIHLSPVHRVFMLKACLPKSSTMSYFIPRLQCLSLLLFKNENYKQVLKQPQLPASYEEVSLRLHLLKNFVPYTEFEFKNPYNKQFIELLVYGLSQKQLNEKNSACEYDFLAADLLINKRIFGLDVLQKKGLDIYHINGENSLLWIMDRLYTKNQFCEKTLEYLIKIGLPLVDDNSRFYTFFDYVMLSYMISFLKKQTYPLCSEEFFQMVKRKYHREHKSGKQQCHNWPSKVIAGENLLFKLRDFTQYKVVLTEENKKQAKFVHKELKRGSANYTVSNFKNEKILDVLAESMEIWYLLKYENLGKDAISEATPFLKSFNDMRLDNTSMVEDIRKQFYTSFFNFFKQASNYMYARLSLRWGPPDVNKSQTHLEQILFNHVETNESLKTTFLHYYEKHHNIEPENNIKPQDEVLEEEPTVLLFTKEKQEKFEKMVKGLGSGNSDARTNSKDFVTRLKLEPKLAHKTVAKSAALLEKIQELYESFPHFDNVIEHIENHCVLQNQGDGDFYVPPLLLAGGPGIGKTFFCHTIAQLVDTPMHVFNMESMTGSFEITGLSDSWGNSSPGNIFNILVNKDRINPIFIFDELDKAEGDERFSPTNCLLTLLERYTAENYKDECIQIEIDASKSIWIATANNLEVLSSPLKSRFDIFDVPSPNWHQRRTLIQGIYKTLLKNNSWGKALEPILSQTVLDVLADSMGPGAARDLRRAITTACAKAIRHQRKEITLADLPVFHQQQKMPWDNSLSIEKN